MENLVLLRRRHHRFVHEHGYAVKRDENGLMQFKDARGRLIPNAPPRLRGADEGHLPSLTSSMREMPWPKYAGRDIDYGYVIGTMF